jgi:hypothetical protein
MRFVFVLIVGAVALTGCGKSWSDGTEVRVERAKKVVAEAMRDPESTKFRDVVAYTKNGVCGEVNAKNAYGGYVGYKKFIVTTNGTIWVEPTGLEKDADREAKDFADIYKVQCVNERAS